MHQNYFGCESLDYSKLDLSLDWHDLFRTEYDSISHLKSLESRPMGDLQLASKLILRAADCRFVLEGADLSFDLRYAIEHDHRILLESLLQRVHSDKRLHADPLRRTALYHAASSGRLECVRILVKYHADLEGCDVFGVSPLAAACRAGYLDVVKALVEAGAKINAGTKTGHGTPLLQSAYYGRADIVQFLLQKGAQCKEKPSWGASPLFCAIHGAFAREVKYPDLASNVAYWSDPYAYLRFPPCLQNVPSDHPLVVKQLLSAGACASEVWFHHPSSTYTAHLDRCFPTEIKIRQPPFFDGENTPIQHAEMLDAKSANPCPALKEIVKLLRQAEMALS